MISERDSLAQESRDRETRILSLNNDLENLRSQLNESERVKRLLQMELDESVSALSVQVFPVISMRWTVRKRDGTELTKACLSVKLKVLLIAEVVEKLLSNFNR